MADLWTLFGGEVHESTVRINLMQLAPLAHRKGELEVNHW
jgi:hypothetical protein